ncbi:MAG: protein kinase [Polyangiales bacterium]
MGYQLDGKYNIEAVVARGGYGVVYRARHAVLQTPFAVKVLRVPDDISKATRARFLDQFVEEARIVAQLSHPSIVRVTDFGVSMMHDNSQAPWMVLEWIEGQTLAANLLARRGAGGRTPRECLTILRPVIDALASAHEAGIAHRDIKPGNVMLPSERITSKLRGQTRTGQQTPISRVLDFGIAKIMNEGDDGPATGLTKTHSAAPAFSPRYASPEQVSGTRTGPWTDVHALGLILTEMLTDLSAYPTTDKMELHVRVMSPVRPTPAHFGVDVGPWEPVLARAMALRPSDRYANAGELLAALEATVPDQVAPLPEPDRASQPAVVDPTPRNPIAVVANPDTGPTLTPTERLAPGARGGARKAFFGLVVAASLGVGLVLMASALRRARPPAISASIARASASRPTQTTPVALPAADAQVEAPTAALAAPVPIAPVVQQVAAPVAAPPTPTPAASTRGHGAHHGRSHHRDADAGRLRPE